MKPPCPTCDRIHATAQVEAVNRFRYANRETGFRAVSGGPVRATRAEAQLDVCPGWVESERGAINPGDDHSWANAPLRLPDGSWD